MGFRGRTKAERQVAIDGVRFRYHGAAYILYAIKRKYFYISIIVFICTYILNGLVLATHVYYTRDVLGNADLYSIIAVISVIATIIGISIAPKLFAKMGKQKTLILREP